MNQSLSLATNRLYLTYGFASWIIFLTFYCVAPQLFCLRKIRFCALAYTLNLVSIKKFMNAMIQSPLVTVGVALYNHADYIEQCLTSVLNQTYQNIEIIVIDDGSKDSSFEVARRFLESQKKNQQFTIETRANQGMCNTLNEIAQKSKGQYISFIGSDDFWMQNKILDQLNFLEDHPELILVHSNSIKVDSQGKEIKKIDYSAKINSGSVYEALIRRTGGINTPSHLYRTNIYQDIGYYDPAFSFEDTDFWLRLSKKHQVGFINQFHTYYRWHGKNLSDSSNALNFYYDELIRIFEKNITEPDLRRYAIKKIYKKCAEKSLQSARFIDAVKYIGKYIKQN